MKTENATCPAESVLAEFGLGKLDAASAETVSQHLDTCTDCRDRVASLSGDSFVNRLRNMPGHAADPAQAPGRIDRTFVAGESVRNATGGADSPREAHMAKTAATSAIDSAPPELANHPDYELLKELGRGGMGVVYLARNRMMDRLEVLKVVNKSLLDRPGALERFQQEIRSAARLLHPNIVVAHAVLRPGDLLVFAMEYVRGQDLSQVVKARGQLPVANAAFYIHQIALGLQHAHEKGMVHRDIKPNNLMLAVEGKKHIVKILDFGLSKATSEKGAEAGLTKSGQMLGTPDYVAPEQTLNAQRADIRADIYSLGCTLYFLLSGGPPFQEQSLYGILEAHQKRDPRPLNLVRPDVPVELATVVGKMMAKEPAKRYQTPAEVARALVPFFKPGQAAATADLPPRGQVETPQVAAESPPGSGMSPAAPAMRSPPAPVSLLLHGRLPVATSPPAPVPIPIVQPAPQAEVSIDTNRRRTPPSSWWSMLPPWRHLAAVAGGAALLLWGIALLVRTPRGTIELEFNEPNANVSVAVDGNKVDIDGLDDPLSLEVGEHELKVRGKGYETYTKKLTITRGKNSPLTITLQKQKPPKPAPSPRLPPTFENALGMEFVLVPKGKSWLGGGGGKIGDEEVEIAHDFYLGKYEITQEEWEKVMEKNPSHFSHTGAGKDAVKNSPETDLKRFPVEMVSWDDCQVFVARLNEKAKESGWVYRLPTEAEWEYACRCGPLDDRFDSAFDFYFDKPKNQLRPDQANFGNQQGRTCTVGSYKPNRLGLYDMHGNVHEWCDNSQKAAGGGSSRVFLGGGWYHPSRDCGAAIHYSRPPTERVHHLGLRLARIPLGKEPVAPKPREEKQAVKAEFTNSLGMEFVLVPKGKSWLGGGGGKIGDWEVEISQDFYLGRYTVTQEEWQKVMEKNPSHFSRTGGGKDAVKQIPDDELKRFPVEMVSWEDCKEFVTQLNEKAKESGWVYRLPTEKEWEYACRGGPMADRFDSAFDFYFDKPKNQLLPDQANFGKGDKGRTCRVGSYKPNRLGLHDMHGNVHQWCDDDVRVLRGGSKYSPPEYCRAATRFVEATNAGVGKPLYRGQNLGLRLARIAVASASRAAPKETRTSAPPAGTASGNPPPSAIAPFDAKQALAHQEAWAKHLGTRVEIENTLGMKLRLIPPGEFTMGSPQAEIDALVQSATEAEWQGWFRSEGPRRGVQLTQVFYLGSCEVTQQQYQKLMGVNPSVFSPTGDRKDAVKGRDTGQLPVEMVSWFDAIDFCNKLSEKEQRPAYYVRDGEVVKVLGGAGYRLPAEAEWEYACRAGTTTRWSFGDNETNLAQHAWFGDNSNGRTQRVGALPPNPFGLYDLYGNVWEWCWDWQGEYAAWAASDPPGPAAPPKIDYPGRVLRGGAYTYFDASDCRSARRFEFPPMGYSDVIGFRVCCGR